MVVAQPDSPATWGIHTLEVRWIFPGELETALVEWFAPFTAANESREDAYLGPRLPGLSVKIRAGRALEVKVYRGSPGFLDVAARARGRMESWQKWSFPCGQPALGEEEAAGWRSVHKRRRIGWFSLDSGPALTCVPAPGEKRGCTVELTEVITRGGAWWTLGFETTGPAGLLQPELQAAAERVFAHALPDEVELGAEDSTSYAEWLWRSGELEGPPDSQAAPRSEV